MTFGTVINSLASTSINQIAVRYQLLNDMNVTFGIMESLPERIRKKANRYAKVAERALEKVREIQENL